MTNVNRKHKQETNDALENKLLQTSLQFSSITTSTERLLKYSTENVLLSSTSLENTLLTKSSKISTSTAGTHVSHSTTRFSEKPLLSKSLQQADAKQNEFKENKELDNLFVDSWAGLATFNFNQEQSEKWSFEFASQNLVLPKEIFHEMVMRRISDVRETKIAFIQFVASSLVDGSVLKRVSGRRTFVDFLQSLSKYDPEFILKTAVYCRRELNIRTTANAILACACYDKACYPFLDKYFSAAVYLPSDWIEVAEYFKAMTTSTTNRITLPKPMRRNMIAKFSEFDEYQLAKHNKQNARNKRARKLKNSQCAVSDDVSIESSHPFLCINKIPLTLKHLVRVLHIRLPTFTVMCILGKKYPSSATDFVRLGLEGTWDPSLSGTRMRLPIPFTWETELSKNGNNSKTWESLILSGRLPFVAMLRNLRNIIKSGVSWTVQEEVAKKLSDPRAVMSSNLFPFRFFAAYVVLNELDRSYLYYRYLARFLEMKKKYLKKKSSVKAASNLRRKTIKTMEKIKVEHMKPLLYNDQHVLLYKNALGKAIEIAVRNNLPPICGSTLIICSLCIEKRMNKQLEAAGVGKDIRAVGMLLALMCASVCENNTMYVMLHDMDTCYAASDLALAAHGPEQNMFAQSRWILEQFSNQPSYSLKQCLEDIDTIGYRFNTIYLIGEMCPSVAKYVSVQRANLGPVNAVWSNLPGTDKWPEDYGDKSNWIIIKGITDQVLRYIAEASNTGLVDHVERIDELYGLTKPFVVPFPDVTEPVTSDQTEFQVDRPITEHWRCCRIFISSTFRDMHAERDLICGLLLPALRQYAAREFHVHVLDVDLRWGVPESATRSSQALEMCLLQAAKADLFVLLVGDRYGWIPPQALLNTLPKPLLSELSTFYVPGMSITEMEYNMAKRAATMRVPPVRKRLGPGTERTALRSCVFAFARDPASLSGVPEEHMLEFIDNNPEKKAKLNAFKSTLKKDGVLVLDNYPAWFNGLIDNRAVMGNLTQFGNELKQTLQNALMQLYKPEQKDGLDKQSIALPHKPVALAEFLHIFVEPVASSIAPRQLLDIERAANALVERGKQCRALRLLAAKQTRPTEPTTNRKDTGSDGAILVITGSAGCGKTTHLTSLAMSLWKPRWTPPHDKHDTTFDMTDPRSSLRSGVAATQRPKWPQHQILIHFAEGLSLTGLAPKSQLMDLLNHWTERLFSELELAARLYVPVSKRLDEIRAESISGASSGKDTLLRSKMSCLSKLIAMLQFFPNRHYAFLLDSADHLKPALFDWLPEVLPSNVRVVLTCDSQSPVAHHFSVRPDCLMFTVSSLSLAERSAAVRAILGRYGKVLDECGSQNQLSLLVNKRSAEIPFYLKLACEELRLYGKYRELDAQLKTLPDTIPKLVQHIIARAEAQSGSELVLTTLALLACSRKPLSCTELHALLDAWLQDRQDEQRDTATGYRWKEFLKKTFCLNRVEDMLTLENGIQQLLIEDKANVSKDYSSRRFHIPPLAFHVLLAGIRPLLAGLGDEEPEQEDSVGQAEPRQSVLSSPIDHALGLLRLRNPETRAIVQEICFSRTNTRISTFNLLGYHKPTAVALSSSSTKRLRPSALGDSNQEKCLSKPFSGVVEQKDIYWLLATSSSGLEHKIFYFFHAGQLEIVCRLLLSPTFLIERLKSGQASLLLEDFQGYVTNDSTIQDDWRSRLQDSQFADRLSAMRQFIAVHSSILTKYPFLFIELAANYEPDPWIRQLGLVQLTSTTTTTGDRIDAAASDRFRFLIQRSHVQDPVVLAPHAIFQPGDEIVTAVALSPSGLLIAYGTSTGVVNLVDVTTMHVIRSFFGHGSSVLSLCFLTDDENQVATSNRGPETDLCLASTAQDKTICLWLVSRSFNDQSPSSASGVGIGRQLISWAGPQRQAITCSAWHPKRRLFATGSLDCTLVLWQLPKSVQELESVKSRPMSSGGESTVQLERKVIRIHSSSVSAVAFRVPTNFTKHPRDEVAVGCWNGTVRIFDLFDYKQKKTLNVSTSAISSLAYSPSDGGNVLATQDIKGQLFLWNTSRYTLLVSMPKTEIPCDELFDDITLKPWLLQHGKVCFSKPSGRYVIQSGGPGKYGGQITVWNSHLGANLIPWRSSQSWQLQGNLPLQNITACAAEPFGRFLLVGSNEGGFAVICAQSGRILPISNSSLVHASRVNAIACAILSPKIATVDTPKLTVLGVLGFESGLIQIITFTVTVSWSAASVRKDNSAAMTHTQRTQQLTVTDFRTRTSERSQSILCVATNGKITATGSQNGCGLIIFKDKLFADNFAKNLFDDMDGSAVTSVALQGEFVAFGMKSRCVNIFRARPPHDITLMTTIHGAANDWITALAWGKLPRHSSRLGKQFLVVGSNDQTVRTYSSTCDGEFVLQESLDGPGGYITDLSVAGRFIAAASSEGRIRLWSVTKSQLTDELTTLDFSSGKTGDGGDSLMGVLRATLFFKSVPKRKKTPLIKSEMEEILDKLFEEDTFLERIDGNCLRDDDVLDQSSTDSEATSDSLSDNPEESCDVTSNHSKRARSPFRGPASDWTGFEGQQALELCLIVGQQLVLPGTDSRNPHFRFGTFAPLVPQQRALLQGHPGLVASGLATGASLSADSEGTLVSVVEPLDTSSRPGSVGCDLRLWQLPLFQEESSATPIQHSSAITAVCPFLSTGSSSTRWFLSASFDGSVIFWRRGVQAVELGKQRSSTQPRASSWMPAFRLICSSLRIASVVAYLAPGPLTGFYCVCFAVGRKVWHLCLSEAMLTYMEQQGTVTLDQLKLMNDRNSLGVKAYVSDLQIQHSGTRICLYGNPQATSVNFIVTNDYDAPEKFTVDFQESCVSMSLSQVLHSEKAPLSSAFSLGYSVYGFDKNNVVSITEIKENDVTRLDLKPLFARTTLGSGRLIEPVDPIPSVSASKWFLVASVTDNLTVVQLLDEDGQTIARAEPIPAPLTVTALCSLVKPSKTHVCYFAVATSDGFMRLMERNLSDPNTLSQVGLCPTGERITDLRLLNEKPLQLTAGTQSGRVIVYEVI